MTRIDPTDLIDLAILLLIRDEQVSARTAVPAIQRWGAPVFQPTADVVASRIRNLIHLDHIDVDGPPEDGLLSLTPEGHAHAAALLSQPERGDCTPVQLAYAMRLGLAQQLPNPEAVPAG
jgi:hypothetical protein